MRKTLLALLSLVILSSTAVYAASSSNTPVSDWINSKTSKITEKEKEASQKAEEQQKKREEAKKQAEQKKQERQQKVETKKQQLKDLFTVE